MVAARQRFAANTQLKMKEIVCLKVLLENKTAKASLWVVASWLLTLSRAQLTSIAKSGRSAPKKRTLKPTALTSVTIEGNVGNAAYIVINAETKTKAPWGWLQWRFVPCSLSECYTPSELSLFVRKKKCPRRTTAHIARKSRKKPSYTPDPKYSGNGLHQTSLVKMISLSRQHVSFSIEMREAVSMAAHTLWLKPQNTFSQIQALVFEKKLSATQFYYASYCNDQDFVRHHHVKQKDASTAKNHWTDKIQVNNNHDRCKPVFIKMNQCTSECGKEI